MEAVSCIMSIFKSFFSGSRLIDGGEALQLAKMRHDTVSGIVAFAGGGQASATRLTAANNQVDTVASPNDSVKLPLAIPGRIVRVYNNTANSLQVFGEASNPQNANAGDTIIPIGSTTPAATGTGVAHATNKDGTYVCYSMGVYKQLVSG